MAESPWQVTACDLLDPIDNIYILAVIDYYTRWIELDILKSTNTSKIVESLKRMLNTHGLPYEITMDNGPQFVFSEFKDFCERNKIHHRRITPLWPQANAEIERQMRNLNKVKKIAYVRKADYYYYLILQAFSFSD